MKRKDNGVVYGKRINCSAQPPPPAWPGRAVAEPGRKTWDGPKPISVVGSTGSIGTQVKNLSYEFNFNSWTVIFIRIFSASYGLMEHFLENLLLRFDDLAFVPIVIFK